MAFFAFGSFSASAARNKRNNAPPTVVTPPTFTAQPAILGTPVEDASTGFFAGTYAGTLPISAVTRFLVDDATVGAENDATYLCLLADVGKTLKVRVTATNAGGSVVATSAGVVITAAEVEEPPVEPEEPGTPGTATLTWDAPEFDGDNATLTDLNGFKVYWSQTFGGTDNSATVSASTFTYTTPLLPVGRWYFMLVAVDSAGNESNFMASREGYFKDIA